MWNSLEMSETECLAPVPKRNTTKWASLQCCCLWYCKERRNSLICSLIICVYLIIGAAVFKTLESPFEDKVRREQQQMFANFSNRSCCYNWTEVLSVAKTVLNASKYGIVELPGSENHIKWDSWGSLFFAASVVSTIGYGNVVPATVAGQKFCIIYALLGVPLCLTFVYTVGKWFTGLCDYIKNDVISNRHLKHFVTPAFVVLFTCTHIILPSIIFSFYEDWTYHESIYFCFITISTVGFGDYVAGEKAHQRPTYKIILIFWTFYGMALLTSIVTHVGRIVLSTAKWFKVDDGKAKMQTDAACQTEEDLW